MARMTCLAARSLRVSAARCVARPISFTALLPNEAGPHRFLTLSAGERSSEESDSFGRFLRMMGGVASVAATAAVLEPRDSRAAATTAAPPISSGLALTQAFIDVHLSSAMASAQASSMSGAALSGGGAAAAASTILNAAARAASAEASGSAAPRLIGGGGGAGAPAFYSAAGTPYASTPAAAPPSGTPASYSAGASSGTGSAPSAAVSAPPSAAARAGYAAVASLGQVIFVDHRELSYSLTFGSVVGFCSGYAVKKVGKVAAVTIGLAFIAAQALRQLDSRAHVDWSRVENAVVQTLDTDGDGKLTHIDVKNHFDRAMTALAPTAASSTAFIAAFIIGLRCG